MDIALQLFLRLSLSLLMTAPVGMAQTGSATVVDPIQPGWVWSGMAPDDDPDLQGHYYAGGPGSYGVYSFKGTGVDVVALRGPYVAIDGRRHKTGSIEVSIDNHVKALNALTQDNEQPDATVYTITGLPDGLHVVQIKPTDGWIAVGYLRIYGAASSTPSADGSSKSVTVGQAGASGTVKTYGDSYVLNGSFEQLDLNGQVAGWTPYGLGYFVDDTQSRDGMRSIVCQNNDGTSVYGAGYTAMLNQVTPQPVAVSGWSRSASVDGKPDPDYSAYADVTYTDGTWLYAQNIPFDTSNHDWQRREIVIWPAKPIKSINVYALFRHHRGIAWFDAFDVRQVYFGQ